MHVIPKTRWIGSHGLLKFREGMHENRSTVFNSARKVSLFIAVHMVITIVTFVKLGQRMVHKPP